jgi:transcriptional regulator with XRE-family HTH domain
MSKIGKLLRLYRTVHEVSVRDLAQEIGFSAATLCRIESGKPCDQKSLLLILNWLFGGLP